MVLCVIAFFLQENGTSSSDPEKKHAEAKVPVSVVKEGAGLTYLIRTVNQLLGVAKNPHIQKKNSEGNTRKHVWSLYDPKDPMYGMFTYIYY